MVWDDIQIFNIFLSGFTELIDALLTIVDCKQTNHWVRLSLFLTFNRELYIIITRI